MVEKSGDDKQSEEDDRRMVECQPGRGLPLHINRNQHIVTLLPGMRHMMELVAYMVCMCYMARRTCTVLSVVLTTLTRDSLASMSPWPTVILTLGACTVPGNMGVVGPSTTTWLIIINIACMHTGTT